MRWHGETHTATEARAAKGCGQTGCHRGNVVSSRGRCNQHTIHREVSIGDFRCRTGLQVYGIEARVVIFILCVPKKRIVFRVNLTRLIVWAAVFIGQFKSGWPYERLLSICDGDAIQIAVGRDAVELLGGCDAHCYIAARGRPERCALARAVIYRAQLVLTIACAFIKKLAVHSAVCGLRGFNGCEREIVVAPSASRPRRQVVRIERQVSTSFAIALEVDRVEFAVSYLHAVSRDALSLFTHCGKLDLSAYIHGAKGVIAPLLANARVAPESYGGIECLHCVVRVSTRDQLLLRHESRQLRSGQNSSGFYQLARLLRSARCRK